MRKVFNIIYAIAICSLFFYFFYGAAHFKPPIVPCHIEGGYCSKDGTPKTAQDLKAFERWQTTIEVLWPLGMIGLLLVSRSDRKKSDK
jgi:hypothetical protein